MIFCMSKPDAVWKSLLWKNALAVEKQFNTEKSSKDYIPQ